MVVPRIGYWPDPADAPVAPPSREAIVAVADDGSVVRGTLWTPAAGAPWSVGIVLGHPRGDFSVHYACELLAAAGYGVLGFNTRYLNNDTDCQHDLAADDVITAVAAIRSHGADAVVLLGNSGGGSLQGLAMRQAAHRGVQLADAFIALAAHPGEGVFMLQVIDPSVTDEADPFSVDPRLDMFNPDNGWRAWPNTSSYDPAWVLAYRDAQRQRVARIDATANALLAERDGYRVRMAETEKGSAAWNVHRRHAVHIRYLVTYRTLADPAHLDPTIDPDDRPLGSIFAAPDPLDANYGYGGLGRVMTPRGWLSTWSGLSSGAALADSMPGITVPTLVIHPTADTEIRLHQARATFDASGAVDKNYVELKGASHYLHGHRRAAVDMIVDWLRARVG